MSRIILTLIKNFEKSNLGTVANVNNEKLHFLEEEIGLTQTESKDSENGDFGNIVDFLKGHFKKFEINPNRHYSEHEALRLIGAAISKGKSITAR